MNWPTVRLLYTHELRMLVRARRTVISAIVFPAVIMPLMLLGTRYSGDQREKKAENTTYQYAISGPWAQQARTLIAAAGTADEFSTFHRQEVAATDADEELDKGVIDFYVATFDPDKRTGLPRIEVVFRGHLDTSKNGSDRMLRIVRAAQHNASQSAMTARGFPEPPERVFAVAAENTATDAQISGSTVGRFITLILVMLMFTGGSIAAMDIIAGEKERGTLETLVTTAAGRTDIVTAKQMAICSVALAITLIQAVNFLIYVQLRLVKLPTGFSLHIPALNALAVFSLFVPLAAAIAATLLIVSAYAKTYKEAQLYFFPVYLTSMVPALASILPGIRLRSIVAFIPVANVSVAVREILMGRPDAPMIVVAFLVMTLTAIAMIRFSATLLAREDLVVSSQHERALMAGGDELFRKRVLQWFAVMWAVTFAAATNIPRLQTFRAQILFNEVAIFLGCSLLMAKQYRLNLRKTLRLHAVPWPVWIAIPIAVPAAQVTTMALFKLIDRIIPAPEELLRQLNSQFMPKDLPMWQMYLFVAVLPAICEEVAFRGLLLHGLRRRFSPAALCLVVGAIFGVFHYTLFRILPTAFLGVILTAISLMTGSILPGILFHAANNAFAVWAGNSGWNLEDLGWGEYGAAFLIFALAMWIIYRCNLARRSDYGVS